MVADNPNLPPPPMPADYKAKAGATDMQALTAAIKAQQEGIEALTAVVREHTTAARETAEAIIALTQAFALLAGEELGTPVEEGDGLETDMDGIPIR